MDFLPEALTWWREDLANPYQDAGSGDTIRVPGCMLLWDRKVSDQTDRGRGMGSLAQAWWSLEAHLGTHPS